MGWLVTIGIATAVIISLFVFLTLGMAVSDFAAGKVLLGEAVVVGIVAVAVHWWRRRQN